MPDSAASALSPPLPSLVPAEPSLHSIVRQRGLLSTSADVRAAVATTFPRGAAKALLTVTRPSKGLFLLSMHNAPDNRLTPDYIKHSLLPALDHIELAWRTDFEKGDKEAALVITGEREKHKFFSNGLDLAVSNEYMGFFKNYYYTFLARVVTFPIHTVAAINGHCFAGGFALAQACDWRVVRAERAWLCMNELDFGAPLPPGMASLLSHRLTPQVMRKTMITAHRWTAPESLAAGIVDEVVPGDGEAVITRALELADSMKKHSASGCLQMMKQFIHADVLAALDKDEDLLVPADVNEKRYRALQAAEQRDLKSSKL